MVEKTNTTAFKTGMNSLHWVYILVLKHFVVCNASNVCQITEYRFKVDIIPLKIIKFFPQISFKAKTRKQ